MPRLNHRLAGPVAGPTLLLLHPLGADLGFWEECIAAWGPTVRTLAVDLRSAGGSPSGAWPPAIADHVGDLRDLLAELDCRDVVVIGCALGSAVAAALAAREPGRIRALVMANPEVRLSAEAQVQLRERAAIIRAQGPGAVLPAAVDAIFAGLPQDDRYWRYVACFAGLDRQAHADSITGFLSTDVARELAEVRQPVLLVPARLDAFSSEADLAAIVRLCPAAEVAWLEGAGHFGPFQAPTAFATLVAAFLRRQVPPFSAADTAKE